MQHLTKDNPIPRIDFGPLPPELDRRGIAEEGTRRDLTKSYEQLLADAHHEITDSNRTAEQNLGFSNRRLGGIFARAAMAMDRSAEESANLARKSARLNRSIRCLTIVILIFTVVAAIAAAGQFYYARASHRLQVETKTRN
jgi:hypothetical protein